MINAKKKTFACALLSVACVAMTPVAVSAQDTSNFPTTLIDVYQDGTLFITYEEYLERQRRVEAARAAPATRVAPAAVPRVAPTAQVARNTNSMSLRNQWTIGAFR